jgi:hypothetical protein
MLITSSPLAWNVDETNSPALARLNRLNGDAMARHGYLATLQAANQPSSWLTVALCERITRHRKEAPSVNASVRTGKSYYFFPIHIATPTFINASYHMQGLPSILVLYNLISFSSDAGTHVA